MVLQAIVCHLFILRARASVVGVWINADATAGSEDACDLDVFGGHQFDEVFHDDIDAVFVEVTVVAEGEEIKLQTLALYHQLVGNVAYSYLSEVGLAGDGTQRGELRAVETHPIVVVGMLILKHFQHGGGKVEFVVGLFAELLQIFLRTIHIELIYC